MQIADFWQNAHLSKNTIALQRYCIAAILQLFRSGTVSKNILQNNTGNVLQRSTTNNFLQSFPFPAFCHSPILSNATDDGVLRRNVLYFVMKQTFAWSTQHVQINKQTVKQTVQ